MQENPYLWLMLGGLASLFVSGRWNRALAAWLAPLLLLHALHDLPTGPGLFGVWLVTALATGISHWRVVPVPWFLYPFVLVAITLPGMLPYVAERLLAPALPGLVSTLVFPLAWTASEYLGSRLNPFGTWGSLAYTQAGNLRLAQLASVAGLWGIIFIVTWFAALASRVWDYGLAAPGVLPAVVAYAVILGAVLVFGHRRLRRFRAAARQVRIATVGWPEGILETDRMMRVFAPDFSAAERDALDAAFARIHGQFLAGTAEAARAGARLVVWPEANIMVFRAQREPLVARLAACAAGHGVYLLAGIAVLDPSAARKFENTALLFGPDGRVVMRYTKTTAVPGFESRFAVRGEGCLPLVDSPHGRLTTAICYDLDFPWLLRQAGQGRADLLLVPASDWREIGELHHVAAVFRAIENGVTLVRATRWGWSAVVDGGGRALAVQDHFATREPRLLVAEAPVGGRRTLYARFGDAFAWLCLAGLLGLVSWAAAHGVVL